MTTRAQRIKEMTPQWEALLNSNDLRDLKIANERKYDVITTSTRVWLIYQDDFPVFFFGIQKGTFLGHGTEMWFMPCVNAQKKFRRTVLFARRGIHKITNLYGHTKCVVDIGFAKGQRFVEYFDFKLVGEMTADNGRKHYIYEKRASWR